MRHRRDAGGGGTAGPVIAGAVRAAVPVVARRAEHRVEQAHVAVAAGQLDRVVVAARVVRRAVRAGRLARAVAEIARAELVAVLAVAAGGEHRAPEALRVERRARGRVGHREHLLGRGRRRHRPADPQLELVEVQGRARRAAALVGGQAHPEVRVTEVVPTPGVRAPSRSSSSRCRARSRVGLLVPRFPVGTAVDHVVPASHDSWTPIVELLHDRGHERVRETHLDARDRQHLSRPRGGDRRPAAEQAEGRELLLLAVGVLGGVDVVVGVHGGLDRAAGRRPLAARRRGGREVSGARGVPRRRVARRVPGGDRRVRDQALVEPDAVVVLGTAHRDGQHVVGLRRAGRGPGVDPDGPREQRAHRAGDRDT